MCTVQKKLSCILAVSFDYYSDEYGDSGHLKKTSVIQGFCC